MSHQPTQTPWHAKPTAVYDAVYSADDELICFAGMSERARENAKFIVRAVNAHADLVAALSKAINASPKNAAWLIDAQAAITNANADKLMTSRDD